MEIRTNKPDQQVQARSMETLEDKSSLPTVLKVQVGETTPVANHSADTKIDVRHVNFFYGAKQALYDVSIPVRERVSLRQRVGMVFQRANPFPQSIFENVAYGLRIQRKPGKEIEEIVEQSLRGAALWDEVKDRLKASALGLSGGQQQRLCIARALAVKPEAVLMDEPCSALDPIATLKIEELITELSQDYTIVIVTHNMQQAARVSHYTGFFLSGKLIEYAPTMDLFQRPQKKETEDYVSGRFG